MEAQLNKVSESALSMVKHHGSAIVIHHVNRHTAIIIMVLSAHAVTFLSLLTKGTETKAIVFLDSFEFSLHFINLSFLNAESFTVGE